MLYSLLTVLACGILFTSISLAGSRSSICGNYFLELEGGANLTLSENEKILICGSGSPGWAKIPQWQALRQIRIHLEALGYYNSTHFVEQDLTIIVPGQLTKISSLIFRNTPKNFEESTFLGGVSEALTRKKLDEIEGWAFRRLRNLGYACPKVGVKANSASGVVSVSVEVGLQARIGGVERDRIAGVQSEALSRFDAFLIGDIYSENNLNLTSRRLIASGVADHSDFSSPCGGANPKTMRVFHQRLSFGKPKRLQLAIGASTEQFPIVKGVWKNTRWDSKGSQVSGRIELSPVSQGLTVNSHWHPFLAWPRLYVVPEAEVERLSEKIYTTIVQKFSNGVGLMLDDSRRYYGLEINPTYNFERTVKGEGPRSNRYLSFETSVLTLSHDYEYFLQAPRSGYTMNLNWRHRSQGLESVISSNRYQLTGSFLWNWRGFDPPLVVFGFRYSGALLYASEIQQTSLGNRLYLGGDNDIRGFARKSINNGGLGFGTSIYLGSEVRFLRILPYAFQPFLFLDFAKVGRAVEDLDPETFYAPGVGVRWQSPFGSLRATAARGLVAERLPRSNQPRDQWTIFLSYGKEF